MPPSRHAIELVNAASEQMREAQGALLAFVERPGKTSSPDEMAEHRRLVERLQQSIANYWDAFNAAAAEDLASRR